MDKKAELYRCGKEIFRRTGFKDTSVAATTRATGTFYLYYPSKEALFFEIYNNENVSLKRSIMADVDLNDEPMSTIQTIMQLNYVGMPANPILREWYNRDVFSNIEKSFREANGLNQVDFSYSDFIEIVKT